MALQPGARSEPGPAPSSCLLAESSQGAQHPGQAERGQGERVLGEGSAAGGPGAPVGTQDTKTPRWQDPLSQLPQHSPAFKPDSPQTSSLKVPCRPCSPRGILLPGNSSSTPRSWNAPFRGSGSQRARRPSRVDSERHGASTTSRSSSSPSSVPALTLPSATPARAPLAPPQTLISAAQTPASQPSVRGKRTEKASLLQLERPVPRPHRSLLPGGAGT